MRVGGDASSRRITALLRADAELYRAISASGGAENRAFRAALAEAGQPPSDSVYREKLARCTTPACERQTTREQRHALRRHYLARWQKEHAAWNQRTTDDYRALHAYDYEVTDAAFHWLDRRAYQETIAWANAKVWRIAHDRAHALLSAARNLPQNPLADGDEWCGAGPPDDPPLQGMAPQKAKDPYAWCPDSAQVSLSIPGLGGLSAGCREVALETAEARSARRAEKPGLPRWPFARLAR